MYIIELRLIYSSLLPRHVLELLSRFRFTSLFSFRYNKVALLRGFKWRKTGDDKSVRSTF